MEFTNFDQMNQMIATASGLLTQTLLWVLCGLALGLSVCSLGGTLWLSWRDKRQAAAKRAPAATLAPPRSAYWVRLLTACK